jgi:hypothetical protein
MNGNQEKVYGDKDPVAVFVIRGRFSFSMLVSGRKNNQQC